MSWLFRSKKKNKATEENLRIKVAQSQLALLEAATTTADAAQHVTKALRGQLNDSIKQFETTARLISDALIICDNNGNIKAFNPAAEIIFATTSTEMEQVSVSKLFRLNGKIPNFSDLLIAIEKNNQDGLVDSPLVGYRCNKETFAMDASASLLDREDGSVLFLLLIRDLSDIIEIQNNASAFNERFQKLFNLSFDGILIIQNSMIVAANKEAAIIFGMDETILLHSSSAILLGKTECDGKNQEMRKDGVLIDMRFSSTGITWNGSPARLVTVKRINQRSFDYLKT